MIAAVMSYALAMCAPVTLVAWLAERAIVMRGGSLRGVWIMAMALSLLVPASMIVLVDSAPVPTGADAGQMPAAAAREVEPVIAIHELAAMPTHSDRMSLPVLNRLLAVLWIALSAGLLLLACGGWIRLQRLVRRLPQQSVDGVQVRVAERMGPAVFGFLHPQIVLPRWLTEAPRSTRAMVLAHERSHIAAADQWLVLGALLLLALAPWNPLLWWQMRRLRFAIEVDCDRRVLSAGIESHAYGEMLLSVGQRAASIPFVAMAVMEPAAQLERRIRIMMTATPSRKGSAIVACAALLASAVVAAAQLEPPDVQWQRYDREADAALVPYSSDAGSPAALLSASYAAQMRERLTDPQQRSLLRAEREAVVRAQHPDLAQALHLDPAAEASLIRLLTDGQMERLDRYYSDPAAAGGVAPADDADGEQDQRIATLLGPAVARQYGDYRASLNERREVAEFDEQLPPGSALSTEQSEAMVRMLVEMRRSELRHVGADSQALQGVPAADERVRAVQKGVALDESGLRRMQDASRRLLARLAGVLTPEQLAQFEQTEQRRLELQSRWAESKR
jgi:beta-lactamase regulating signal transducer with metallopeptidase domain